MPSLGWGFPGSASGKDPACQRRRQEIQVPSLGWAKMSWRRAWPPTRFLAWRIPLTEEPCGLQSKGSQRVRHET